MKREIIDASQFELEDKVVSIKRVTKVVKGGREFPIHSVSCSWRRQRTCWCRFRKSYGNSGSYS